MLGGTQSVTMQSGAKPSQTLAVQVYGAKTNDLGVSTAAVSSVALALSALSAVDVALTSVSSPRSTLGAQRKRLEFTLNRWEIQAKNGTALERAIREVDIAAETVAYAGDQFLVNAGRPVLAQGNLVPETELTLLG